VNLSEPFIRRPVMTVLLTLGAVLFGVLAYKAMPVSDLPNVDYPVIQVQVAYPGATPETMANNVATPLERQFMQIPGLELVTSNSAQGFTSFTLQFDLSKSIDGAATDVQAAISRAQGQLPVDLPSPPTFTKTNPNDQPQMYLAVMSNTITEAELYDYAVTQVGQRISIMPGVSQVQQFGTPSAVRIKADPSKLAVRGMTMVDLDAAIRANTAYVGAGQFDGPSRTLLLQPQGQLSTAAGYNDMIVGRFKGSPVYMRDVARVVDGVQDERQHPSFWFRDAKTPTAIVVLPIYRQAGANAVEVSKRIEAELPNIKKTLPPSVDLRVIYDRSASIVDSFNDVQETLLIAFILVVLVIFIFLGRATDTLIPTVALPLSLLLTFVVMNALGYSLDNLSLMALTLAIGFLVDDAIVFLENVVRRMEKFGEAPMVAAMRGAQEISFTILSMTIALAAVFLPLVFMSGLMGRIFREFSITIVVAIFASGIVSLTLTPLMCARMLSGRGKGTRKTFLERVVGGAEHRVLGLYGSSLWFFLRHRWISALVWVVCLIGTTVFFTGISWNGRTYFAGVHKSFLPTGDSSFLMGVMIAQQGSSPAQMQEYQKQVEAAMQANPDVRLTITATGISQFLNSNYGFCIAFLAPPEQRVTKPGPGESKASIQTVAGDLMTRTAMHTTGLLTFLVPQPVLQISTGASPRTQGDIQYSISGVDPTEVYATAGKLMGAFYGGVGKVFAPQGGVSNDMFLQTPNLQIEPLRDQAATYGVNTAAIEALLNHAVSQNYTYLIKKPTNQYQVILELDDPFRTEPADLNKLYVKSADGQRTVPLNAVATWHESIGPQAVNHLNQFTSVTFSFNAMPGVPLGDVTDFIQHAADQIVPPTMKGTFQGQALTFRNTVSNLTILMFMAVFVMYIILGILYESYLHPVTVLSALPVALVGGLFTLWLFGEEASLYAYIGMFMLMGIVKKNGIMIVDFAQQRVAQGIGDSQAIHDASMDRFRPIIMTTLAAVMGAVPIALGFGADGAGRRPLGLVIIGGLIVSQFITLYVTPAIYLYLEEFQEKVLDRTGFFRSSRKQHELEAAAVEREGRSAPRPVLVGAAEADENGNGYGHD
jgi:hydrophobic/amphiphilic exporter-1 (mainly G- bacteria), HAE1 family